MKNFQRLEKYSYYLCISIIVLTILVMVYLYCKGLLFLSFLLFIFSSYFVFHCFKIEELLIVLEKISISRANIEWSILYINDTQSRSDKNDWVKVMGSEYIKIFHPDVDGKDSTEESSDNNVNMRFSRLRERKLELIQLRDENNKQEKIFLEKSRILIFLKKILFC